MSERNFIPRVAQHKALSHILDVPRCNIWMDPGMGKTASVYVALDALRMAGSSQFPALVIAPPRVAAGVWAQEQAKWADFRHLSVSLLVGSPGQRDAALKRDAMVYVVSYNNVPWLVDKFRKGSKIEGWPFKTVVADESTKLRSFRLRNGGKRAWALGKAAVHTGRWVNLTGTPTPSGLHGLWGQQWFIDMGASLGRTYTAFENRFFDKDEYTRRVTAKPSAMAEITKLLAPSTLNLSASDYEDLPEDNHITIPVTLDAKARARYEEAADGLMEAALGPLTASNAAHASAMALQVASGAIYTDEDRTKFETVHNEKIEALRDLIDELGGKPLVVCYWWGHDLARLKAAFPQGRELKTTKDEDDWNAGRIPLLFLNPASAGHGLNLQWGGHHMVFFTSWWNTEDYLQVIERIGPMRQLQAGLNRPVFYYYLVAQGTVDEAVVERRQSNCSIQEALRRHVTERSSLVSPSGY